MKVAIYVLLFIIAAFSVTADSVGIGKVSLSVINNPPEIVDIKTSEPFEDEPLRCDAVIKDEIEDVQAKYKWYNGGVLVEGQEANTLSEEFFKEGDLVTCEVTPNDLAQDGETKSISVVIKPEPFASAITGAVIGVGKSAGLLNSFLLLLLAAIVIFNVAYFLKKR